MYLWENKRFSRQLRVIERGHAVDNVLSGLETLPGAAIFGHPFTDSLRQSFDAVRQSSSSGRDGTLYYRLLDPTMQEPVTLFSNCAE